MLPAETGTGRAPSGSRRQTKPMSVYSWANVPSRCNPGTTQGQPLSSVADHFLICSGSSDRQVRAIAEAIEEQLIQNGEKPLAMEGYHTGTWVLIDCADLIVHVFDDDTRRFYDLERLWHRAARVEVPGVALAMSPSSASEALLVEER